MNYLYLGLSDLYLPATAAAMHIESLEMLPPRKQLLAQKYFRPIQRDDEGKLFFAGKDARGNGVYIACISEHPEVFVRGVQSLLGVCHLPLTSMQVVPCVLENPQVGTICRLLRRLGLQHIANRIGLRVVHNRQSELVQHILALS